MVSRRPSLIKDGAKSDGLPGCCRCKKKRMLGENDDETRVARAQNERKDSKCAGRILRLALGCTGMGNKVLPLYSGRRCGAVGRVSI